MHKKSMETTHETPGKPASTETPTEEETVDQRMEVEKERPKRDSKSSVSTEELRENSIAALRAKAQEHSAKMLTVSDRIHSQISDTEEEDEQGTAEVKKTN